MYIFEYRRLRLVGRSRSSGAKRGGRRDLRAGLWLLLEFGVGGRAYAPISHGFAYALMVVVAVLEWTAEVGLVERTTRLAWSGYGALASIFSILAGGEAFVLLRRAAVRHVQKTNPVGESLRVSVDA
jgi:hypothetical protein